MGVVDDAIECGVGNGRVPDVLVPFRDGQLPGDHGGAFSVTIFDDLEDVATRLRGKGYKTPIVDDQDVGLGPPGEQAWP